MKFRTLISTQRYFGLEPVGFRRGAGRTLARLTGLAPEQARVSVQSLCEDFRLDRAAGDALASALVTSGLLEPDAGNSGHYRVTPRFSEFALARVGPPLPRARAKELLVQACRLATQINAEWTRNPLSIDMIAVSGDYMRRSTKVAELTLWIVVKSRATARSRLGRSMTKAQAASEIRGALRALSAFIRARIVTDAASVERPCSVPYRRRDDPPPWLPPTRRLRPWSFGRRLLP